MHSIGENGSGRAISAGVTARTGVPSRPPVPPPLRANSFSYWQLAKAHKFLILGFVLLGFVGGIISVIVKKPMYSASTIVEIVGFNQSFMGMNQVDPEAGTDNASASASNIQTQTRILTSRTLLARVTDRMNLEMGPVLPGAGMPANSSSESPEALVFRWVATAREKIPFLQKDSAELSREALGTAAATVSARGIPPTRLIEIQCESTSPQVAANFVNTLAAEHAAQTLAARSNVTQKTSQWMDSQLEEAKSRLKDANDKLQDFVKKSGLDFFPEQSTLADTKVRGLQGDLSSAQADRIAKQSRWELARNTPIDSLPDVLNDGTLQGLKAQIAGLRREMATLTTTLTPENLKVQRVQAQITATEQTLEKEKAGLLKRLQSDYEESSRREKLLADAYSSQTRSLGSQADKAAQYAMLKRDVETDQQLYNLLLQESNQAALVALAPSNSIRVVDAALPTSLPSTPKPFREIPTNALLGGLLGYGLVWLKEWLRNRKFAVLFEAPGHTRTVLGVPELGVIPSVSEPVRKKKMLPVVSGSGIFRDEAEKPARNIGMWQDERSSLISESFRQTLVSLLRTRLAGHTPVYVITSAGAGEGKTTLSANLARAMAEVGQRVLLVDADLRRPHVHNIFGAKDHTGLSEVLSGAERIQDLDLNLYIQPTPVENLSVLTHGVSVIETPPLLFFSPRVSELVLALRTRFDCVILDTAPALPFPDARLWGRHSDGIVLVVRSGMTTREGASAVCDRFLQDGIPVLGTILNDWKPRDGSPLEYYYYQGQGSSKKS